MDIALKRIKKHKDLSIMAGQKIGQVIRFKDGQVLCFTFLEEGGEQIPKFCGQYGHDLKRKILRKTTKNTEFCIKNEENGELIAIKKANF